MYLHASTLDSLLAQFDAVFIKSHLEELHSGIRQMLIFQKIIFWKSTRRKKIYFRQLLIADKNEDLQRMYSLVKEIPEGLEEMKNQMICILRNRLQQPLRIM